MISYNNESKINTGDDSVLIQDFAYDVNSVSPPASFKQHDFGEKKHSGFKTNLSNFVNPLVLNRKLIHRPKEPQK